MNNPRIAMSCGTKSDKIWIKKLDALMFPTIVIMEQWPIYTSRVSIHGQPYHQAYIFFLFVSQLDTCLYYNTDLLQLGTCLFEPLWSLVSNHILSMQDINSMIFKAFTFIHTNNLFGWVMCSFTATKDYIKAPQKYVLDWSCVGSLG